MKISPFSSKEKKSEYLLGLDIGSAAVKSIIFQRLISGKEELKKIIIWGRGLEYFDKSDVFDIQDFEENTIKNTISQSINGAYQSFLQNLGRKVNLQINKLPTLVNLPPNIIKEKVMSRSLERENEEMIISKKEEIKIRNLVIQKIKQEIEDDFSQNFGISPEDIQFLSFNISEIKIDGYNVLKLEGFKGKKIDFKIVVVFSLKEYFKNIEIILKGLKVNFSKLINKEPNIPYLFTFKGKDIFVFDIGGEVSQFFLIKNGKTEAIFELGNGGFNFTDKLSKVLGLNLEDARNLKHNYSNFILSEEVRKKVREILSEEIRIWFSELKKSLRSILEKQKTLFPSDIFIFGGGSLLPEIKEILEEGDWEEIPFVLKPNVKLIYPKDLEIVEDKTKGLLSIIETSLILACLPQK